MKPDATPAQIEAVRNEIQNMPEVRKVTFVDKPLPTKKPRPFSLRSLMFSTV